MRQLLLPFWTKHPGVQKPPGTTVGLQSLFFGQSASVEHPQKALAWQTGLFSGLHAFELFVEHSVHCPASGPDVWHAGND
jgi:hypothetical protein